MGNDKKKELTPAGKFECPEKCAQGVVGFVTASEI
jgi:hypothetical protein